jgi:hypothetical protein
MLSVEGSKQMKKYTDIFQKEIDLPDIVNQKMEKAFAQVKAEEKMMNKKNSKVKDRQQESGRWMRNQAAAFACVCVLALGSITAVAAVRHFWSRGMAGTLQASDELKQSMVEQGNAVIMDEEQSVTDQGITITPETVIVDDNFAFLSFSVEGYTLGEGVEPCFESVGVYLGDDPDAEGSFLNMSGSFYDGIITDENGHAVYDDGTPLEQGENGDTLYRYTDEDGKLEYVIIAMLNDRQDVLLGKTIHCNFRGLGTVYKAEYTGALDGSWNFAITLPTSSQALSLETEQEVEGTEFTIEGIKLSPISIEIDYAVNGEVTMVEDENGVPDFCGVVLKDGTRLPYLANGGSTGYQDESLSRAYTISCFDRIIEPDQVAALLLRTTPGEEMIEAEIH